MKKLLIGTSALVAAGLVAGAAHAADPIKLSIGGFGSTWVTFADQDDAFLRGRAFNDGTTRRNGVITAPAFVAGGVANPQAGQSEVTGVDVKGDAEVIFTGSTTLDNGLKVSFSTQLEAGGRHLADPIDEYSLSVAGSFGTVVMGATNNALAAIAVTSPRVGGRLHGGAFNEGDVVSGSVILAPTANTFLGLDGIDAPNASFVNTNGDSESISYISPSFAGFTVGATYVPDAGQVDDNPVQPSGINTLDAYGVGAAYSGEFSGVGLRVAGGWLTGDASDATANAVSNIGDWNEYQIGANVSYAGFTFGGGYRKIDIGLGNAPALANAGSFDRQAWDLGMSYRTGPYGISLAYFESSAENGNAGGAPVEDDTRKVWELNAEYTMGPGVALVGGIAHAKFEDGLTAAQRADATVFGRHVRQASENSGWAVSSGISLSF